MLLCARCVRVVVCRGFREPRCNDGSPDCVPEEETRGVILLKKLRPRATPSHWRVRRLHGARPPRSRREMLFAAARCEGGPRGPRPRPSPGGAARLSARGGCAGGAAVGGRGASAGGLAYSVRGVARLGGGVDARRAAAATRALVSGDARDGSSYDDKLAAARAARAVKPTPGGRRGRAGGWQRVA